MRARTSRSTSVRHRSVRSNQPLGISPHMWAVIGVVAALLAFDIYFDFL